MKADDKGIMTEFSLDELPKSIEWCQALENALIASANYKDDDGNVTAIDVPLRFIQEVGEAYHKAKE